MSDQMWRSWTCGVCNQPLTHGMQRCPRCRTPVSPPDHPPYGRDGILGDALPGYQPPQPIVEPADPPPAARRRLAAIGIVAAVLALLVGVVWATSGADPKPRPRPTTTSPGTSTGPTSTFPTSTTSGPPTTFGSVPPTSGPRSSPPSGGPQSSGLPPPTTGTSTVPQLSERWNVKLGPMAGTAALNGTQVVVATRRGTVVSLDAHSGKVRWNRRVVGGTPNGVIVHRGMVITRTQALGSASPDIVAIDGRTGRIRWRRTIGYGGSLFDQPAAVGDGRIYVVSDSLVALDLQTGRQVWKASGSGSGISHVPAFAGGQVVVSDFTGTLRAYDAATGAVRWRTKLGRGAPVALGDLVLVQALLPDRSLYAVDAATGKVRWRIPSDGTSFTPVARVGDTIVVPNSRALTGVSATEGTTRWTATSVPGAAVAAAGTSVYAASYKLSLIDGRTGRARAEGDLSDVTIFPPVPAGDTTVVIMTDSVGGYR